MSLGFFFFFFFSYLLTATHTFTHTYRVPCSCNGHLGVIHPILSHDISACAWEEAWEELKNCGSKHFQLVGHLCSLNVYCSGCVSIVCVGIDLLYKCLAAGAGIWMYAYVHQTILCLAWNKIKHVGAGKSIGLYINTGAATSATTSIL